MYRIATLTASIRQMAVDRHRRLLGCLLFVFALFSASPLVAQEETPETSRQLWANYIMSRPMSEKLYLEFDAEGGTQVSGGDPWRYLYGTGLVEYYPSPWVDLTGELVAGFNRQNEDLKTFETTVRLGFRLHLIRQIYNSPFIKEIRPERISDQRFSVAFLSRLERRNFSYFGDRPSESDVRWRNRLEFKFALNKASLAEDGVWYLITDSESFTPLGNDAVSESFSTKFRVRLGLGYRRNYTWRFDALLIRDNARDTVDEEFKTDAFILDLRVMRFF